MTDQATREQLWKDPDWVCPHCKTVNLAIRDACRSCNYIGGEFQIAGVLCLEVTDDSPLLKPGEREK